MKNSRLRKYQEKEKQKTTPLTNNNDVPENPDKHIDQDFPGYPHAPAGEENINPKTKTQKKTAGVTSKDQGSIIMDMPEVKDIEGQENIRPPHIREMMDTTISSADEEGEGLLDDLNKDDADYDALDENSNVSEAEKNLLSKTDRPVTEENKDISKLALDKSDGTDLLNEGSDPSVDMGSDLDIPGAELDDEDEAIGEEDEENNAYSRPD
jgi:hypothetical protein